jgi:uncharacterized protein YdhG (YjbR/CyaY superfamily)
VSLCLIYWKLGDCGSGTARLCGRSLRGVGDVDAYLSTVEGADRDALQRIYSIAREVVPAAQEGTSYGMPALLYRDKGLIATVRAKKFLSLYPYSGMVIKSVLKALNDFETTAGSIHFSVEHQLPDAIVRRIVEARRAEIDATAR